MEEQKILKVGSADVILFDYKPGQGKIIISDPEHYINASTYWGAMGSNISDFIKSINSDYFANKLFDHNLTSPLNPRKTTAAIKKAISEELPWYKHLEFQKEMRRQFKRLYSITSAELYAQTINSDFFMPFFLIDDRFEREDVESIIKGITLGVYDYMVEDLHPQFKYLEQFHSKLVKEL